MYAWSKLEILASAPFVWVPFVEVIFPNITNYYKIPGSAETVPIKTVNRQCSSDLQLSKLDFMTLVVWHFILYLYWCLWCKPLYFRTSLNVMIWIGIGVGLESMTINSMRWDGTVNPRVKYIFLSNLCYFKMCSSLKTSPVKFTRWRKTVFYQWLLQVVMELQDWIRIKLQLFSGSDCSTLQ